MFDQLRKEIAEAGYSHMSLEALQDIKANKVKLTHAAHEEFNEFMLQGSKMFAPA